MAFLDDYGKPENDLGEWVEAGKDSDGAIVKLRVRPIPEEVLRSLMKRYTKSEQFVNAEGMKTTQPVARDWQDNVDFIVAQAAWMLVDSENLTIRCRDEEAARLYGKAMGRENLVTMDEPVRLDGKLTDAIKDRLLRNNGKLRTFVVESGRKIAEAASARIAVLEGNS
jgi:hypothetical protein